MFDVGVAGIGSAEWMVGVIAVGMPLIRSSSVSALTNFIEIGIRPDLRKRRWGRSGIGLHREIGGLCGLKPTRPIIAGTGSIQRGPSSSRTRNRFTSYSSMVFSPKMYRPSSSRHLRFDSRSIIPFIIVRQRTPLISASFHMGTMH